ncbi:MAG: TonB-dependent receptor [Parvularculaceae bacterium]
MRRITMNFSKATALCFASAIAMSAGSAPALAQSGETAATTDEIIVSARRRDESLQDVPVAVSAFNGDKLETMGAVDLTDIGDITPNVTLETSRATNSTLTAFIRGVGQQDPVAGFEAGVGIYIDDVYLNRPQAALLDIYDVERIEVLRGPQGTLYGRNTIGGAVKYVTKRLTDDPSATLRLTGGTYGQFDAVGSFSLPVLIDSGIGDLRVGGGVAYLSRNGFGENLVNGVDNYDKDIFAARASIEWEPTDALSIRLSGDWTQDDSNQRAGHRLLPYTLPVAPFTSFPVLEDVFDTRAALYTPEQSVRSRGISNVVELKASDTLTFKNIVSYRDGDSVTPIDFDSLPLIDLDVPGEYRDHQFSEEFQVLYQSDRLSGVAGFYYLSANARTDFDVLLSGGALNAFTSADVDTRTWSIFGDFSYELTDRLSVSVGGRYTEDERTMAQRRAAYLNDGVFFPLGTLSPMLGGPLRPAFLPQSDLNATAKFDDFSPRASISYKINDDHTTYVSYAKGFKGGSFDPRCLSFQAPDLDGDGTPGALDPDDQRAFCLFQPESINTYDFGLKSVLGGGAATSNFAVFYSDYTDVQIPGSLGFDSDNDGIADNFAGITTNAASATLWGIEWEGNVRFAEDLMAAGDAVNFQFSLGYISAEFDEYLGRPPGPGLPPADLTNVAVFQNTPEVTAFGQLNYDRPLGLFGRDGGLNLYTSFSYKSETNQFNFRSPIDQPGYALLNAGMSWTTDGGGLTLGVHGTNLTDKRYIVAGYDFVTSLPEFGNSPLGSSGVLTAFYGNPRQIFGTIKLAF